MSKANGDCEGCGEKKTMTRGQFLATGASAAAAASLGLSPPAAHATERDRIGRRSQQPCPTCSDQELWEISGGLLNALWSDCFPRLVARWWQDPTYPQNVQGFYLTDGGGNPAPPTLEPSALAQEISSLSVADATPKFADRRDAVANYLQSSASIVPIRYFPGGGWDLVLSDWGLDLFAPDPPTSVLELVRYYTFRRTGRPGIGLPFYMAASADFNSPPSQIPFAIDTDSPTGPSQATIEPLIVDAAVSWAVQEGFVDEACVAASIPCGGRRPAPTKERTALRAGRLWRRLVRALQAVEVDPPDGLREEIEEALGNPIDCEDAILRRLDGTGIESDPEVGRMVSQACFASEPGLSVDEVKCILRPLRCWQLSGSVYRGVQVELPRIIATMWVEQALDSNAANVSNTYASQIITPDGLRNVLKAHLESSFHPDMAIAFHAGDDLKITNHGLLFPTIRSLFDPTQAANSFTGVTTESQALLAVFAQIEHGRAGNPVFTDSVRTD